MINGTHLNSRIQIGFGEEIIRNLSEVMTLSSVIKSPFRRTGRRVGGSDVVGETPRQPSQMAMWQVVPLSRNNMAKMPTMGPRDELQSSRDSPRALKTHPRVTGGV